MNKRKYIKMIFFLRQEFYWSGNAARQNSDSTETSKIRSALVPYIYSSFWTGSYGGDDSPTYIMARNKNHRPKGSQTV